MSNWKCPLCGEKECKVSYSDGYTFFECSYYHTTVGVVTSIESNPCFSDDFKNKMYNLICERIAATPVAPDNYYWKFYYNETEDQALSEIHKVNVAPLMKNYPESVTDIANRVLMNLAHLFPDFGGMYYLGTNHYRLCFPKSKDRSQMIGVLEILVQFGYLVHQNSYTITAEGWKKVEELKKKHKEIKQAFVAMAFGDQTKEIREGFRTAINEAGYSMRAIDEKEHNNQIVPEIFYEIQRSKFVVVDVTYPNYGAYYEAGYAYGLGKEVIVCCSKEAFENKDGTHVRPHFDISQKSMVIWDDIDDLKERLQRRIEATVK